MKLEAPESDVPRAPSLGSLGLLELWSGRVSRQDPEGASPSPMHLLNQTRAAPHSPACTRPPQVRAQPQLGHPTTHGPAGVAQGSGRRSVASPHKQSAARPSVTGA